MVLTYLKKRKISENIVIYQTFGESTLCCTTLQATSIYLKKKKQLKKIIFDKTS